MTVIVAGVAEARRAVAVGAVARVSSVGNEHVRSPAMSYPQRDHYLQYLI